MIKKNNILKNNNILLYSFIINISFLLASFIFCAPKYEVSDDFMVDAVLSGAYGYGLNEHMLFQNIILGYILKGLYSLIPGVSWYFVMQIFLCFLALTSVTYVILFNNHRFIGIILSIIFVAVFSEDVYILVNYTKTAGLSIIAGGSLLLHTFWHFIEKDISKLKTFLGVLFSLVLIILGTMFRWQCIYPALLIIVPLFFYYIYTHFKNIKVSSVNADLETKKRSSLLYIIICFVVCCMVVTSAYIFKLIDSQLSKNNHLYANYTHYSSIRSGVTDVRNWGYGKYEDDYESLNYDKVDYYMIGSWNFLDQDYFTEENLEIIADFKTNVSKNYYKTASNVIDELSNRKYLNYHIVWGVIIISALAILLLPQKAIWFLISNALMIGLLIFFFIHGRVLYRIDYVVIASTAVILCHMFSAKELPDSSIRKSVLIIFGIVMIFKLSVFIPDTHYKYQSDDDYRHYTNDIFTNSGNYDSRKYRIDFSKHTPYDNIIARINEDTEHYYLLDFNTCIQNLYYNYMPWKRIPEGTFANCSFLGGVTTQFPDNNQAWSDHGIDITNPYLSICNNNIYVVDNINYYTKLDYIKKNYFPDARIELIDEIDGFKIWKFYKE